MTTFVSRKIASVLTGHAIALGMLTGGAYLFSIGTDLLVSNLALGMLTVSISPLLVFLAALAYQRLVVGCCRQLSVMNTDGYGHIKKSVVLALQDAFKSTRYVPMLLVALTFFICVLLVSPLIVKEAFAQSDQSLKFIACLAISGQLMLGCKAAELAYNAYNNVVKVSQA